MIILFVPCHPMEGRSRNFYFYFVHHHCMFRLYDYNGCKLHCYQPHFGFSQMETGMPQARRGPVTLPHTTVVLVRMPCAPNLRTLLRKYATSDGATSDLLYRPMYVQKPHGAV
jgi:hypothetical protein